MFTSVFRAATGFPWIVAAVVLALVLSYLAVIGVALFHPRAARRRDARHVLERHLFTRRRP